MAKSSKWEQVLVPGIVNEVSVGDLYDLSVKETEAGIVLEIDSSPPTQRIKVGVVEKTEHPVGIYCIGITDRFAVYCYSHKTGPALVDKGTAKKRGGAGKHHYKKGGPSFDIDIASPPDLVDNDPED